MQHTGGLARQAAAGRQAEAHTRERVPQRLLAECERDLARADVARLLDHARHGERAVGMHIADHAVAELDRAAGGVDERIGPELSGLERRRDRKRLHCRAGLEQIGDRAVARRRALEAHAVIGIEIGLVDHREHLAGLCVEHHRAATARAVGFNRGLEFAIGEVLHVPVEAHHQILTGLG